MRAGFRFFVRRSDNEIVPIEDSFDDHGDDGDQDADAVCDETTGGNVGKTVPPADPEEREADTSQNDGDVADKS
ncbi:MAG: hypothetical protein IKS23_00115 [Alphaproteobacteria bacterium]|nr:hypothetical protein [Alphaproteobacteria bacterium]